MPLVGNDFVSWLNSEMSARDWSQSDLSRKSGITTAQISRVLSRERLPGIEFCKGVARAFGLNEIHVIEIAGIAFDAGERKHSAIVETIATMLDNLSDDDLEDIKALASVKLNRKNRA